MPYVKVQITTPKEEVSTAFEAEEFKKYLDENTFSNVSDKDFLEKFNQSAPQNSNYQIKATKVTQDKPFVDDIVMDRLTMAEYALNAYKNPENALSNISKKLHEHKHLFGGRKVVLNSNDSIQEEKKSLKKYYNDFKSTNKKLTEQNRLEIIDYIIQQQNNRK